MKHVDKTPAQGHPATQAPPPPGQTSLFKVNVRVDRITTTNFRVHYVRGRLWYDVREAMRQRFGTDLIAVEPVPDEDVEAIMATRGKIFGAMLDEVPDPKASKAKP